jgi:hypothetical protein
MGRACSTNGGEKRNAYCKHYAIFFLEAWVYGKYKKIIAGKV